MKFVKIVTMKTVPPEPLSPVLRGIVLPGEGDPTATVPEFVYEVVVVEAGELPYEFLETKVCQTLDRTAAVGACDTLAAQFQREENDE